VSVLRGLGRLQARVPLLQLLAVVALYLVGAATIVDFTTPSSLSTLLVLAALLGLASLGQTGAVLLGGLDLSIPGFILAGAVATAKLHEHGWPLAAVLVAIALPAAALGATSGSICHRLRIQPLVFTLAMGAIVGGATIVWSDGAATASAPQALVDFTAPVSTTFGLGIPRVAAAWIALACVVGIVLARTRAGRLLYATGSSLRSAELALVPTRTVWAAVYAVSATMSALVGALLAGFSGTGDVNLGDPYLFQSLAAVIVGGTTFGARGSYWSTVLGALILTELSTILVGNGLSAADQRVVFGLVILIVVAFFGRSHRLRDRV